jgi:putative ABC transport system permease protein
MLKNYLLTAFKVYTRRKLFTAINLLCIVLTLLVLLVVTALLQNTFYPGGVEGKSARFLQVTDILATGGKDGRNSNHTPLGYKLIEQYLRPMKSPLSVAAVSAPREVSVYQTNSVNAMMMRYADAAYWEILDFKLLAGRLPSRDDVARGRFVAVINQSSASKLFAGVAGAVGQKLNLGGQQFEVIGVVEDVIHLNAFADIWAPVTTLPSTAYRNQIWGDFTALLLARDAADIPMIKAEVAQVAKTVQFDDPKTWSTAYFWGDSKIDWFARMLFNNIRTPDSGASTLLQSIIVFMLVFMLLPALNLVNLNTGRIMERSAEIGVRKAFGASSRQLVAQFVTENILLCLVGGVLGMLGAKLVLWWLGASGIIPYLHVELNVAIYALGLAITVVFGLLSGVIPAWKMSRLDPVVALKGAA